MFLPSFTLSEVLLQKKSTEFKAIKFLFRYFLREGIVHDTIPDQKNSGYNTGRKPDNLSFRFKKKTHFQNYFGYKYISEYVLFQTSEEV